MNLSCLLSLLEATTSCKQLVERLLTSRGGHKAIVLEAASPYLIAALHDCLELPLVVITAQPEKARMLCEELQIWCSPSTKLSHFPELDFLPCEFPSSFSANAMWQRLQLLSTLALREPGAEPPLIVASAFALATRTLSRPDFTAACHVLKKGMNADLLGLLREWQSMGYRMEDVVEVPGTMCRRGGILDVFSPGSPLPARIEFSGNRIESIRFFLPGSQRSTDMVNAVVIIPAREVLVPERKRGCALNLDGCNVEVKQRFQDDLVKLEQGQEISDALFYLPVFNGGNVLDYLGEEAVLVLDVPGEIETTVDSLSCEAEDAGSARRQRGEIPRGFPSPYFSWEEIKEKASTRRCLKLEPWGEREENWQTLPFTMAPKYGGKVERFLVEAERSWQSKQRLLIVSRQVGRLTELFQEKGMELAPSSELQDIPPPGSITLLQNLPEHVSQALPSGGWEMGSLRLITDAELFGVVKKAQRGRSKPVHRHWLTHQLAPGDYVVHVDHGIGRFKGLTRMTADEVEQEYLILEYAGRDRLYVPSNQVERVSLYIGASGKMPSLSRLGTQEWERLKQRVKESVVDIAQQMLAIYASREVSRGFAFSADTLWQQELEASFPYVETADQLDAIMAVKKDMNRPRPMDRLICGDVGYGKTEVALRAAFKAVMDSKQVAILVPTTVLAQQHFATFRERLQTFPVRVEVLSRFCSRDREREVLEGLSCGTVDICIGTHRLLQKDVVFRDLGLVVIDEEQRFGVLQKEKLRQMRKEVDVLTLSATPIPRTLHMSLTGIRDMSIIETPPEERLSVKTYVGPYDEQLMQRAILREMERNGQVFFVHNRIESMALVADRLQALVPEARVAIAHGRVPEWELEEVMAQFVAGNYDVLITTTIIESGLDIPNVNTMIVDRVDRFGLAQLYQLRGRIGRSSERACAYFFFDRKRQLTPQAYRRLKAVFEAGELGAGFSIAMKDLEIRGAGNLLGSAQSGHIAAVGFDLYCQLLARAVEKLKSGERDKVEVNEGEGGPGLSLPLTAFIPEEYVPDVDTRLSLYRRLEKLESEGDLKEMLAEFRDRFGELPQQVSNLFYAIEVKVLAAGVGVRLIYSQGRQLVLELSPGRSLNLSLSADCKYRGAVRVGVRQIRLDLRRLGNKWQEALKDLLHKMSD
ncbi:MAG: transcription-repair coupling factor [Dehalococcoidia bacterium]|nr:transcription-repair coupling factor [Dehalococcoidia bacterium]